MDAQVSETSSEQAVDRFRRLLLDGTLTRGKFLTQKQIVRHLNTSLGPVRTALTRLEADGYVQIVPRKGIQIVEPTIELVRNVTQVRIALEKEAWARFAFGGFEKRLGDFVALQKGFLDEFRSRTFTPSLFRRVTAADHDMHYSVIDHLGNELYSKHFRICFDITLLAKPDHGQIGESTVEVTTNEHLDILNACLQKDKAAISSAIERHLMSSVRRVLTF